jgi:hypothetical protein
VNKRLSLHYEVEEDEELRTFEEEQHSGTTGEGGLSSGLIDEEINEKESFKTGTG